jgi:hypothetical protein
MQTRPPRRPLWSEIDISFIDKRTYGRCKTAFVRQKRYLLLHVKSDNWTLYKVYSNIGSWAVFDGRIKLDEEHYYGQERNAPPTTWANKVIKKYREANVSKGSDLGGSGDSQTGVMDIAVRADDISQPAIGGNDQTNSE